MQLTFLIPDPHTWASFPIHLGGSACQHILSASGNLWTVCLDSWSSCRGALGGPQAPGGAGGKCAGCCPKLDLHSVLVRFASGFPKSALATLFQGGGKHCNAHLTPHEFVAYAGRLNKFSLLGWRFWGIDHSKDECIPRM